MNASEKKVDYDLTQEKIFDIYKKDRFLFILEALVSNFITIIIGGAFIAKLSTNLGITDAVTGIISAISSLGCGFQLIGLFLSRTKRVKPVICSTAFLANLFFALVYVLPSTPLPAEVKIFAFAFFLIGGQLISNAPGALYTKWRMSLVAPSKKTTHNAIRSTVSFVGGMVFSLIMGGIIDHFEAKGELTISFFLSALTIFVFGVVGLFLRIRIKEPEDQNISDEGTPKIKELINALKSKKIWKITFAKILWDIAYHSIFPFLGTYQNNDLEFSMTLVSIFSAISLILKAAFSVPMGRLGDKKGARKMLIFCLSLTAISYIVNFFTVPSNGPTLFLIYTLIYNVGAAGIDIGFISLVYEYADRDQLTETLSIVFAVPGLVGFLTATVLSSLVNYIQTNGNHLFGVHIYAQQILSLFSALVMIISAVYIFMMFRATKKNN